MNKLLRSYTRKTERKHESSGGGSIAPGAAGQQYYNGHSSVRGTPPYVTPIPTSVRNGSAVGGGSHQYSQQQQQQQQQQHQQRQQYESYQQHQSSGYPDSHRTTNGYGYQQHQLIPTADQRYYDTAWNQQQQMSQEAVQRQGFSESSSYETKEHYEKKVQRTKKNRNDSHSRTRLNGAISNGSLADKRVSESVYVSDGLSARDALLQWARRVTSGYSGVNVTNFTNSWKDGLAFNAILHHYKSSAVNWNKISDVNLSSRERLRYAFDAFEKEFGISKLLDPEDVDVDNPDEKSIITYVSSLYNTLAHEDLNRGNLDDIISRLTRGIGITNEKLDLILSRIEDVESKVETSRAVEVERQVREIVDELNALEVPIAEFFEDVETLKYHRHPDANDFHKQVYGLHQRRTTYLDRLQNQISVRVGSKSRELNERYESTKTNAFQRVEEAIRWVRERMDKLNNLQFSETLEILEDLFERHKLDNRDIQDYRQNVDECIARQAEVSAEDSYEYCELLQTLESEYQQLRDLSAGRMLDLDSLIAFIRAAQLELLWIDEREEIEVTRNWSDINQLDLPMLQNYFRQLLHEIELHEKQFNDVHNQGAALINQRHPAGEVIEVYLRKLQSEWDWLLNLSKCLEGHLRDGLNLKSFVEESEQVEQWMQHQIEHLETNYNRSDFSLEEGERYLRELDEIREVIQKYYSLLAQLSDRCSQISPLWQRGERISKPMLVTALCDYKSKEITIQQGDECTLIDNRDLIHWKIRGIDGVEAQVPSVVFRIPPPDPRLAAYLSRLLAQIEKLKKLWEKKHRLVRYNMVLNTMKTVRDWDLDTFLSIPPEQRDEIIKALNEDANKLLSELDPNDPLAQRLKDELRRTNEHFYDLLNSAQKGPEPDHSNQFDETISDLLKKLEEAWKKLNDRVGENVPTTLEDLECLVRDHKNFEDALQGLDVDVSNVKELFRQLPNPTPTQRANHDHLNGRWEDLWDLSRMYVERLKALEAVLQGLEEVSDIVRRHEITLSSFDDLPSALDKLRGVHSQLIELNMVLQQQQEYVQTLNKNVAQLRQHVARTRFNVPSHPDVDLLEDEVQKVTVRWDNVCSQVADRLKIAEEGQQTQMIYRSQYDEEIMWLDRVEATINSLRKPEDLRPEELQTQLDQLVAEYAQLQEHTATIENINKEGGKFIRDAKSYDIRLNQYHDNIIGIHGPEIRSDFRRQIPQPKNGAQIVTEELEALNRRFAQLSSVILERKNIVNVLIQNWKRKQQEEEDRRRADEEEKRRAFEAARRRALEEADRLRRDREAAEAARRAADEADRLRRANENARRDAEEAERRRREEEDRLRRAAEEAERRRREEEERRRREEEERRRIKTPPPPLNMASNIQQAFPEDEFDDFENIGEVPVVAKITEHEDEPQMFQEETVTKTQFYEMEGILHKQTGEILTFVEAIRQGLLDLNSGGGEFFDIVSGSRLSLEKAAEMGLINENISEILNGRHGIHHPETGEEITLLEAIQIGLYDPDSRQLRDIKTGEILSLYDCVFKKICTTETQHRLLKMGILKLPPMGLEHALKNGILNPETGEFRGKYVQDPIPLRDALANGYIQFSSHIPIIAVPLSDCIANGFINGHTGEFIDRNSEDKFSLREALERNKELVKDNIREIVNTDTNQRITLSEAILCHAINPRQGNYMDLKSRNNISLRQAYDNNLISKPTTLTEAIEQGIVDSTGHFLDRGNRYTLVEAINVGLIDPEVRHIVDQNNQEVISIVEALERGVLNPEGKIIIEGEHQKSLDLNEAHYQGLLIKRVRHTIFDVKGIKNTETNINLSFNQAVEAGAFIIQAERVVDLRTKQSYLLSDAARENLIDSMLQEILLSPIGIIDGGNDISLVRAVAKGIIDPTKGIFYDKRSQREITPSEAYHQGYITLRGALRLTALFDVHPLLMTPIKRREQKKRIRRPGQPQTSLAEDQIKVTLSEAMKQGLIDSRTQRFRQGNQEMSLDDALNQGLIDPSSEWIVPSRASAVGPTIEEKTQETVTETGQQLAPKIYPDKQLDETVSTVKRVKRTETSAVGGPGGVSVYRAITGGKGTIEVPATGYHILDAERKGILDLSTGIVSPPGTNKTLTLEEAFNLGILNPSSITIRDPKSGKTLTAIEAFENKLLDKHGFIDNRGKRLTLQQAIDEHVAHVEAELPATISQSNKKIIQFSSAHGPVTSFRPVGQAVVEEHEQSWSFDSSVGLFVDTSTGEKHSLDSALRSGKIIANDIRIRDALTGREMSLEEAQKWGIVNLENGYYLDKTNNKRYSFTEAAKQHRIFPTGGVPENAGDSVHTTVKIQTRSEVSKKEAIPINGSHHIDSEYNIEKFVNMRLYDASSGLFTHPDNKNQITLKELIVKGFLNPYITSIIDRKSGRTLKLLDAIDDHIVDDIAGTVKDTLSGRVYDFASAIHEGLIKEDSVERYINERSENYQPPQQSINTTSSTTINTSIGGHSPRLIERKLQLTPYAQEPFRTGPSSSREPINSSFVKSQVAQVEQQNQQFPIVGSGSHQNEKLVDLGGGKNVMVKVVRGDDGLEKGEYIDPSTGMKFTIQLHGDPMVTQTTTKVKSTSQVQSIELEPHAVFVGIDQIKDLRNNRVMTLQDAQRLGLAKVDKKGKQTTKNYSAFRSNIELAVNKGVIDKNGEKISLEDAIRARIIDIVNLKYVHPKTNEALDFSQAANLGLLDVTLAETLPNGVSHPATGEKLSVQRAVDAGIINPHTGEVRHPFNNERISWIDLTKSIYNSITMNGIYDPKKGYAVPVASALIDGLIDTKNETYFNTITEERLSLEEANRKGIIDQSTYNSITRPFLHDYRTQRQLNLIQAVNANLINPRARTVQISADKILSIAKAVDEGSVPKEIGDLLKRVDKLTFADAVGKGLIDVAQNTFTDQDSGKQITIAEAVQKGLIDTGNVDSVDGHDKTNLTKIVSSEEFDEKSGRVQDKESRLHLTFKAAVDQRVIDPDSLLHDIDSSKTITLKEAMNLGLIDNNGQYVEKKNGNRLTINEAVRTGHLALIGSPMQAAQAVTEAVKRRDAETYKFRIESLDDDRRKSSGYSQPKFREESTIIRLTPQRAEPGLSVRVRSSESFYNECLTRTIHINTILTKLNNVQRSQQEFEFDFGSVDATANARLEFSKIRDRLVSYSNEIEENILEVDRLCLEGAETLSPEQFHNLKENRQKLRTTYETLIRQTDLLLDRLDIATALLIEFSTKSSQIQSWIFDKSREIDRIRAGSGDPNRLSESKQNFKKLENEIGSKSEDLKTIAQLGVRIDVEICNYIDELRRRETPSPSGVTRQTSKQPQPPQLDRHQISETVDRVQEDYVALIRAKNDLSHFLNKLKNSSSLCEQNLRDVNNWLSNLERTISDPEISSADADSRLVRLLEIKESTLNNQPKIDNLNQAIRQLIEASSSTDYHKSLEREKREQIGQIQRRYENLSERIRNYVNATRTEITEKEGFCRGLENMSKWLNDAEQTMQKQRELPLNLMKLNDFKYDDQLKRSELNSKAKTLEDLLVLFNRMRACSPMTNSSDENLEESFNSIKRRFQRLDSIVEGLAQNLLDLTQTLQELHTKNMQMSEEQALLMELINSLDPTNSKAVELIEEKLSKLVNEDWENLQNSAKKVLIIPNVEDFTAVHDMMRNSENALNRLQSALKSKLNSGQKLAENRVRFHEKFDQVYNSIVGIEAGIEALKPVTLELGVLQRKQNATQNLKLELRTTRQQLDEVENLGTELIHSSGMTSKRKSMDLETVSGSGETIGQITRQLFELRKRQDDAERSLAIITQRISQNDELRRNWNAQRENLDRFVGIEIDHLNQLQNNYLSRFQTEEGASNVSSLTKLSSLRKELQMMLQKHRDKPAELASFHLKSQQLMALLETEQASATFPHSPEGIFEQEKHEIENLDKELTSKWAQLNEFVEKLENCGNLTAQLAQDLINLNKWLNSKTRTLNEICLGSSPDAKLINNQLVVLKMLQSEYQDEEPKWVKFNDLAGDIVALAESETFCEQVVQNVDQLNKNWKNFGDTIRERSESLQIIKGLGGEFEQLQNDIKRDLLNIEEQVNQIANTSSTNGTPEERQLQLTKLGNCEKLIDELSPSVEQLELKAENIDRLLADSTGTTDSDLMDKIRLTKHTVEDLTRHIEILKKAATSASIEEKQLNVELESLTSWIQKQTSKLSKLPPMTTDLAKLTEQIEEFKEPLNEILAKESEIVIISRRVGETLNKTPNSNFKQKLIYLNELWPVLLNSAKDKQQDFEKCRKILVDLHGLDVEVNEELTRLQQQLNLKKETEKSGNIANDIQLIENGIKHLEPKINSGNFLIEKLEKLQNAPDTKKARLNWEGHRKVNEDLLQDCKSILGLSQTKSNLKSKFESQIENLQSLIKTTKNNFQLDQLELNESALLAIGKDSIKTGLLKYESKWERLQIELQTTFEKLHQISDTNEKEGIFKDIENLNTKSDELKELFEKALKKLEHNESTVEITLEQGRQLGNEIEELVEKISTFSPIGRDANTLEVQAKESDEFLNSLEEKFQQVSLLSNEWKTLLNKGLATINQSNQAQKDLDRFLRQIDKNRTEINQRRRAISNVQERCRELEKNVENVLQEIKTVSETELFGHSINTKVSELKSQQAAVKLFKEQQLKQIAEKSDEIVANCKELIRSASPTVSTNVLEDWMEKVGSNWHNLSARVEDRERQIDAALQGLGSYNDAYNSLLNWLEETEELVNNQKPPSADYKVVRAQLQNHDFQLKLVDDKQPSVNGFLLMIEKLETLTGGVSDENSDEQKQQLRAQGNEISTRYNDLVQSVNYRRQQLQEAQVLTSEFTQLVQSLAKFLDEMNKSLQSFGKIPTDSQRLHEQLNLQKELQEKADGERPNFDRLVDLYKEIIKLVDVDDANELEASVRNLTSRYNEVGTRCKNCGQLLENLAEDITSFLNNTNLLTQWLDSAEQEIEKFEQISVEPEELIEQSEELTKLVIAVAEQGALVSQVVEESRELCTHASGSEAVALQYRIDQLRNRYSNLAIEAENKIAILSKAIPLSEELRAGFDELKEFLIEVEEDLENLEQVSLEEQFNLVGTIEGQVNRYRAHLDTLQVLCVDLQRLSCESKANELAKESQEIAHRFNSVADLISRKADQLKIAERQSRYAFDVLDYFNDWFNETRASIMQAEKPSADMEFLKAQLKQQRLLNEAIANERAGLRDVIFDASKVARDLSSTLGENQDNGLVEKVERAKKLAEETAELGLERIAELEQASALTKELDESYMELNEWMDQVEQELHACEPITTGMNPKALLQQQIHNNGMLQFIQGQRPITSKFERNIAALSELCSESDSKHLKHIANEVLDRFNDLANAFNERGDALAATIEQSSQFSDRLNVFLSNLEGAVQQVRNSEPPSARPSVLKRQLADNQAILEALARKEDAFSAMKSNAQEFLIQAKGNEPVVTEIAQNIDTLDDLWLELRSGATARQTFLTDCLQRAETFWHEFEKSQNIVAELRQDIDSIHLNTQIEPDQIQFNQKKLEQIDLRMGQLSGSGIEAMLSASRNLCHLLNDDERAFVEQNLVLFNSNWSQFSTSYAQVARNLLSAMDKSVYFRDLLNRLTEWLSEMEKQMDCLPATLPSNVDEIREELLKLEQFRRDIDEKAIHREQLVHMVAELCRNASPQQVSAIRNTTNELSQRWNKLYSQLNERSQRLERALLEMGQFTQAYEQLSAWLDKTKLTLASIDPNPDNLKNIEIELCKFRVVQNDICAHLPSFEAIQKAGKLLIKSEPESVSATQPLLDSLTKRWNSLAELAEQLWAQLEAAKSQATSRGNELERWSLWLGDVLHELKASKPVGGLPETARAQLDDHRILAADVEQKRAALESELERLEQHFAEIAASPDPEKHEQHRDEEGTNASEKPTPTTKNSYLERQYEQLKKDWTFVKEKIVEREQRLNEALKDAIELQEGMQEIADWLHEAENHLSIAPQVSRLPDTLLQQIDVHKIFNEDVQIHKERMKELHNKGVRIQLSCEKKDAIPMKNKLVSLRHRTDKISQRNSDRTRVLENAFNDSHLFFDGKSDLFEWIEATNCDIQNKAVEPTSGERIRDLLAQHKAIHDQIQRKNNEYISIYQRGKALEDHAPATERKQIAVVVEELRKKWEELNQNDLKRQRSLEEALAQSGKFDEVLAELFGWLNDTLPKLEAEISTSNTLGDVETIHALFAEHYNLAEAIDSHKANLGAVRQRAEKIRNANSLAHENAQVQENMLKLEAEWKRLESAFSKKEESLTNALKKAVDLSEMLHELQDSITEIEARVRRLSVAHDEKAVVGALTELAKQRSQLQGKLPEFERTLELARHIHANCHEKAELPMRNLIRSLTGRWDLLEQLVNDKHEKLNARLNEIRAHDQKVAELMEFVGQKKLDLEIITASDDQNQLGILMTLFNEHELFKSEIQSRQDEVEEALKVMKKVGFVVLPQESPNGPNTPISKNAPVSSTTPNKKSPTKKLSSALTAGERNNASNSNSNIQRSARQQKTDLLNEAWKRLWSEIEANEERLKQRKVYLEELKRLENFTFDEWRERYLQWNDHGKARISDLFRRIDKSGTGVVPRKLFIDGILASKFPTTELEMARVADEFDKGNGLISAKEFMNALRFDPKKRRFEPKTETERIHEEIARETSRCTCARRFPIQHISTNDKDNVQYGFGFGSTMKRMVRILRSTVMVRVGGGWEALDQFLLKHDPCRAKGRINIGMFYANDAKHMDQMALFTRKNSGTSIASSSSPYSSSLLLGGYTPGQPGPIMKIREKTERSIPMFKHPIRQPKPNTTPLGMSAPHNSSRRGSDNNILDDSRIPRPLTTTNSFDGEEIESTTTSSSSRQNLFLESLGVSSQTSSRPASRCSEIDANRTPTRIPSLRGPKGGFRYGKAHSPAPSSSHSQQSSP